MGMYNEVYKNCPSCGDRCEIQIEQVTLGFGEFDLDDDFGGHVAELTIEEKRILRDYVEQETFNCDNCGDFMIEIEVSRPGTKKRIII